MQVLALACLLVSAAAADSNAKRPDNMQYFTSTAHLSKLLGAKTRLADALLGFADNETARLEGVREFARGLRGDPATDALDSVEHPVAAFLSIRRMGLDWIRLLGNCGDASEAVLQAAGLELPTSNDFDGAADALVRLQDVYEISAESMVRGQLTVGSRGRQLADDDRTRALLLSAEDCLHLARRAFDRSLDTVGMDWTRVLLASDAFSPAQKVSALPALLSILQERFELVASNADPVGDTLGWIWKALEGNVTAFALQAGDSLDYTMNKRSDLLKYRKLCKDGSLDQQKTSSTSQPRLHCRYTVPHPSFTLAPVKEELLSSDPRVALLYDVLTDAESDRLIEISDPKLRRARVARNGSVFSDGRISKSASLSDSDDWSVQRVNQKLGYITGLNVNDSDLLQMGNYGIGGQYEPHMDSFGRNISAGQNDRVATVLLYLNSVTLGGGTVFPRLGLRVLPVRNAGLFWYNLRRNSSTITDTTHAACPVLEGSKWVANKWIYYLGQMRHRPCGLGQSE